MNVEFNKREFDKITEVIKEFPSAQRFVLEKTKTNGIGSCLDLIVYTDINGRQGEFKVEITGPGDW